MFIVKNIYSVTIVRLQTHDLGASSKQLYQSNMARLFGTQRLKQINIEYINMSKRYILIKDNSLIGGRKIIRIHSSKTPIDKIYNKLQHNITFKPRGLWYAYNNEWNEFGEDEGMNFAYNYKYKLTVELTTLDKPDRNKVLLLNTIKDVELFEQKYKSTFFHPDWKRLAEDFGGIEISCMNSIKKLENFMKHLWLLAFDVNGGCIWNIEVNAKIKLIH